MTVQTGPAKDSTASFYDEDSDKWVHTCVRVPVADGYEAIVDTEDYDLVSQYKWHSTNTHVRYAQTRTSARGGAKRRMLTMHRLILDAPPHMDVDHINHDGLDNRKANLRLCTSSQNSANQRPRKGGTSQYKGVSIARADMARSRPWRATLGFQGKRIIIGQFATEHEAALAYDAKAREVFGEFARLNLGEQ